jgi:NADH-quinone oxidoreductase subunit J
VNETQTVYLAATLLAAAGVWLMLPGRGLPLRLGGMVLGLASFGMLAAQVGSLGHWARDSVFWILAGVTVVAAAGTISFRSPVYCAIWFALSLLGTASLFLMEGAEFLAVATVVVYAGAILVTFLFVLMLAQPRGEATYDRVSWEGLLSASAGAVLVGILTLTLTGVVQSGDVTPLGESAEGREALAANVLSTDHVAKLGEQLFSRYLLAIEVAGLLLLVALVGAAAIAVHSRRGLLQVSDAQAIIHDAAIGNPATPERGPRR